MRKKGYAVGLSFMALGTIALISASLGTIDWTVGVMERNSSDCIVTRTLGLFMLKDFRSNCLRDTTDSFSVFDACYVQFNHGIQYAVVAFCGISVLFSLMVVAISGFNICFNPYETYLSSIGILCYNIIGLVASLVAVVLYTVLLYTELYEPLLEDRPDDCMESNIYGSEGFSMRSDAYFGYSFFLLVVSIVTYLIGICLAVLSERDTMKNIKKFISPKKEQETNDQKMKDIMIF